MDQKKISNYFSKMKSKASNIITNYEKSGELITDAEKKTEKTGQASALKNFTEQIKALIRLVKHYREGTYRDVSKKSMILVVAALLYFISPIDAVPDFLIGIGLVDDAAVLGYLLKTINDEVEQFTKWEEDQEKTIKTEP